MKPRVKDIKNELPKESPLDVSTNSIGFDSEAVTPGIVEVTPLQKDLPNSESSSPDQSPIKKRSERAAVITYLLLYMIQGIGFGFFISIEMILIGKGATSTEMAIYSFQSYPSGFKLLLAPLLDAYYFRSFGKRKSWIVPAQYVLSIVYLAFSFYIDEFTENRMIHWVTLFGFLNNLILSIQDIAASGWAVTLFTPDNLAYASAIQMVGSTLGYCIGLYAFILVNGYLRSIGMDGIDPSMFLRGLAVFTFITTVCIHILKKERNPAGDAGLSVENVITFFKTFWKNSNLLLLSIFLLGWRFAFAPIDNAAKFHLIAKGMSKESYIEVQAWIQPVVIGMSIFAGRLAKSRRELELFLWMLAIKYIENISKYALFTNYTPDQGGLYFFLLMGSSIFNESLVTVIAVAKGSFFNRICDYVASCTYITILNSLYTVGRLVTDSITLSLLNKVNILTLAMVCWIVGGIFYIVMGRVLLKLQDSDREQWTVFSESEKTEKEVTDEYNAGGRSAKRTIDSSYKVLELKSVPMSPTVPSSPTNHQTPKA